jgi:hypothetical protein
MGAKRWRDRSERDSVHKVAGQLAALKGISEVDSVAGRHDLERTFSIGGG